MTTISRHLIVSDLPAIARRRLGTSSIVVEIDDEDFYGTNGDATDLKGDGIIAEALRWLSRYRPRYGLTVITLIPGVQQYILDNDVPGKEWGFGVVNLFYPTSQLAGLSAGMLTPQEFIAAYGIPTTLNLSDLYLSLAYFEQLKRMLGSEVEWDFDEYTPGGDQGTFWISPTPGTSATDTVVIQYQDVLDVEQIGFEDQPHFLDFLVARTKYVVGEKREKYNIIPGEQEGQTLNGPELKAEAQAEIERLEFKLVEFYGDFVPPIMG